jgi:SAM-dependent methyltransferase
MAINRSRVQRGVRSLQDGLLDLSSRDLPPRRLRRTISPLWFDFRGSGIDQVNYFAELAGLEPSGRLLDLGCGVGRVALPLTRYLSGQGSYEGLDPQAPNIDWCRAHISAQFPNFHFDVIEGNTDERETTAHPLPFEDESFDLVYAGALFTDIPFETTCHYLAEAARILKPGGRVVATWLVFNEGTQAVVPGRSVTKRWPRDYGSHRNTAEGVWPSLLYEESWLRTQHDSAGLDVLDPLRVDASYCLGRGYDRPESAVHLYYAHSVMAVRRGGAGEARASS